MTMPKRISNELIQISVIVEITEGNAEGVARVGRVPDQCEYIIPVVSVNSIRVDHICAVPNQLIQISVIVNISPSDGVGLFRDWGIPNQCEVAISIVSIHPVWIEVIP